MCVCVWVFVYATDHCISMSLALHFVRRDHTNCKRCIDVYSLALVCLCVKWVSHFAIETFTNALTSLSASNIHTYIFIHIFEYTSYINDCISRKLQITAIWKSECTRAFNWKWIFRNSLRLSLRFLFDLLFKRRNGSCIIICLTALIAYLLVAVYICNAMHSVFVLFVASQICNNTKWPPFFLSIWWRALFRPHSICIISVYRFKSISLSLCTLQWKSTYNEWYCTVSYCIVYKINRTTHSVFVSTL